MHSFSFTVHCGPDYAATLDLHIYQDLATLSTRVVRFGDDRKIADTRSDEWRTMPQNAFAVALARIAEWQGLALLDASIDEFKIELPGV